MPGTNLVGPYGSGVNEVYGEPDLGDSGGTEFSWYADCSSDVADDGTKWTARWANRIMMQLRRAVLGMGITINEVDGDSLLKAILRAHRPIVNIGGGANIHKGEKMPEWQHELRTLVGTGAVTCTVVGDTIVINAAGGGSETPAASIGTGHPIYKGVVSGTRHFRSLLATHGLAVVANPDDATVRLAAQPGWSIMLRNAASSDAPTGVAIDELTEVTSPSGNDWLMLQRASGRELRKTKWSRIASPWEIAGQVVISSPAAAPEIAFEADKYTMLRMAVENLSIGTYSANGQEIFEASLLSGSTVIVRAPIRIPGLADPQVEGHLDWTLSNVGAKIVALKNIGIVAYTPGFGGIAHDVNLLNIAEFDGYPIATANYKVAAIGLNVTWYPPGAPTSGSPVNKLRVRFLRFSSQFNDVSTPQSFTAGRVTLYGLKREI